MGGQPRDEVHSRCVRPRSTPLEWRDFVDLSDEKVREVEDWLMGLTTVDRELAEAEVEDLRSQAALGRIPKPTYERLKRMKEGDHFIIELRWRLSYGKGRARALRQYHVEPTRLPDVLVALHRHLKETHDGNTQLSSDRQFELQNVEVRKAKFRYLAGQTSDWIQRTM